MLYARIENNTCAEFISFAPAGRFHPSLIWMEIPVELRPYVDNSYVVQDGEIQPPTLDYLRGQLRAKVKARRKEAEESGTTLDGMAVETDRQSQSMLNGAVEYLRRNPEATIQWQLPDLTFVTLDAAKVHALADVVAAHVQGCFARQAAICEELKRRTKVNTLLESYNTNINTGWPGQQEEPHA